MHNDVLCPWVQVRFDPSSLQLEYKTMKSMDKAARLAMMPDYEMYCVDLTEGQGIQGLFRSSNGTGASTARIDTTITSPELTPVLALGTDAPCTS